MNIVVESVFPMELRGAEAKQKTIYNINFGNTFFHTRKFWVPRL
jgi:hypothetical protein